ncbi:hypothetical protein IE81DRAFT_220756 [Ceraceosorus guamensis]|uniref:Uncharacterized protein n=1 Tax=Ceraceosorus guamensis TaxID=1522189 RepID=A0A316VS15_9BASI|nr:hypothetical protein IE81DRAFT_220756 [Ceraceosorus guamensis]PWN40439.1 hypothetical protein IE81DRAFT_220756 [Ceraceosorus guamensis]
MADDLSEHYGVAGSLGDELNDLNQAGMGNSLGDELNFDSHVDLDLHQGLADGAGQGASLGDELGGDYDASRELDVGESLGAELGEEAAGASAGQGASQITSNMTDSLGSKTTATDELHFVDEEQINSTCQTLEECIAFNDRFLQSLGNASLAGSSRGIPRSPSTANHASSAAAGGNNKEDASNIESSAEAVVRQLRESAVEREGQARELRELARELIKGDFVLTGALASDLDWEKIENLSKTKDRLGFLASTSSAVDAAGASSSSIPPLNRRNRLKGISEDEEEELDEDLSEPESSDSAAHLQASHPVSGSSEGPSIADQMQHLRSVTSSLIHSLSNMHEHTQVSRAATSEASRRIRALKTFLAGWKVELEEIQASHDWLKALHADQDPTRSISVSHLLATVESSSSSTNISSTINNATASGGTAEQDVKSWSKAQLERAERILNEADHRAKELLRPVPCEALDRLVASLPPGALDEEEMQRRTKSALAGA